MEMRKKGRSIEYKVRWKGFGEEEDSWEPLRNLKTATTAIDTFKKKQGVEEQTPSGSSRSVSKRSSSRSSSSTAAGASKVTTTKTTVTRTETFSDASDNEGSPVVQQHSTRTVTETHVGGSGDLAKKPAANKCWFSLSPLCSCVTAVKNDLPMLVYYSCIAVIAGTFVWERM